MSLARQNLSDESEAGISRQVLAELTAAYTYQAMASWLSRDTVSLHGLSKFFSQQVEEERAHAQKFIDYMSQRGGRVHFYAVPAPEAEWKSALHVLEMTLKLEREVNQSLLNLHKIAEESEDPALEDFIESNFLEEQVESIKRAADMITELKRAGPEGLGLYLFDRNVGHTD